MQCLEVSGAVRPLYGSLGVKGLSNIPTIPSPPLFSVSHIQILQTRCCSQAQRVTLRTQLRYLWASIIRHHIYLKRLIEKRKRASPIVNKISGIRDHWDWPSSLRIY